MKYLHSLLSILLVLVLVLSCVEPAFALTNSVAAPINHIADRAAHSIGKEAQQKGFQTVSTSPCAADEIVRAIVILEGKSESELGESGSEKAAAQRVKLRNQHNHIFRAMTGISYELKYEYTRLLNGFSCDVAYSDLAAIAAIDGVEAVYLANSYSTPVLEAPSQLKQPVANQTLGHSAMHQKGYLGQGLVVAVLDTGLTVDHEAFRDTEGLAQHYGVLTNANGGCWVIGKYLSPKIPFAFDYADMDQDVTDRNGHGTHVSGTAVGRAATVEEDGSVNVTFSGAAPAAQLLSMKIFSDYNSSTSSDIYFYALEDAYTLGADVINMSLGMPNGFTYDPELETEVFGNIYQRLSDAGIVLSVSAGNEYSMGRLAMYAGQSGAVSPGYTDYGTVGSPASYGGTISVAALENAACSGYTLETDGGNLPYVDTCTDGVHGWIQNFGGTRQSYVLVTDRNGKLACGKPVDYTTINVRGKLAVVSRGETTFEEKVEAAYSAGAIGCIVVNNEEGSISMSIETYEIPAISLQQSALEQLSSAGTLTTPNGLSYIPNPQGNQMSAFSSWGTTPMLTLDPAVTSVGGMVYSAIPGGTNTYALMSGTSMAAPNMAGTFATLLGGLRSLAQAAGKSLSKAQAAELSKDLLFSYAEPLVDTSGVHYSPRRQGAGLGNAYAAVSGFSQAAYLTNPLQELKDDPDKTGIYRLSLQVQNDSTNTLRYSDFETYVLYDRLSQGENGARYNTLTSAYAYQKNEVQSAVSGLVGADVRYRVNATEVSSFSLAPGQSLTVEVTITLTEEMKAYFDRHFPNGSFVEGYVVFNETGSGTAAPPIHATYLAYYGDWTQASALETSDFRDVLDANYRLSGGDEDLQWYNSGLVDYHTTPNMVYSGNSTDPTFYLLGMNQLGDAPYHPDHLALSTPLTDGDRYNDAMIIDTYLLRNAKALTFTFRNKATGELYRQFDFSYQAKSIFDTYSSSWVPSEFTWDGTTSSGRYLPNGTVITVSCSATLPYKDTVQENIWSFDITIDTVAPALEDIRLDPVAKTLTVTASDDRYLQGICIEKKIPWYEDKYQSVGSAPVTKDIFGGKFTATFDVSPYLDESVYLRVSALDYAGNRRSETILADSSFGQSATVTLYTPYGTERSSVICGRSFRLPEGPEVDGGEFIGWTQQRIESATEEEIRSVYYDSAGEALDITGDLTLYGLYRFGETIAHEQPRYFFTVDEDYNGQYALIGWQTDAYNFGIDYLNPYALGSDLKQHQVSKIDGAVISSEALEFFTDDPSICFTFASAPEGYYTIRDAQGRYLSLANGEVFLQERYGSEALWDISPNSNWDGVLISSAKDPNWMLLYIQKQVDYGNGIWGYEWCFDVVDNSIPFENGGIYSKNYRLVTYRRTDNYLENARYTTEYKLYSSQPCYFDDFTDCVAPWYHEAVDFTVSNGLMKGMSATEFGPNVPLSRGMVVTVLYREAGAPAVPAPSTFTDVPNGIWYSDAIAWAQDNGIVNGVTATGFAPDQNVTREQIATILWRYAGSPKVSADLSSFRDAGSISPYATQAILWAVATGIMNGDGKNLNPQKSATRAEFACMVMRYLDGFYDCND